MEKVRKPKNWLFVLLIVENSILLIIAVLFGVRGCWNFSQDMLSTKGIDAQHYQHMHVHAYPNQLVYVIGKDTELDLSGGKICFSVGPKDLHGFSCEWNDEDDSCESVCDMERYAPKDEFEYAFFLPELDFTKAGIYNVVLSGPNGMQCSFPIQVISPDYVE